MTDLPELEPDQRELAQSLREQLRAGEALDFVTAAKLRAARARALAAATSPPRERMRWLAAGGVTAAAMLVGLLVFGLRGSPPIGRDLNGNQLETLEVMTDEMDMEFYEDLDLYEWLARDADGTV